MQNMTRVDSEIFSLSTECGVDVSYLKALKEALFPKASYEMVAVVINYCKARKLDPFSNVVHLIEMSVYDKKTNGYIKKETIMPGIALHRINASRTGQFAGLSEPEFGPEITEDFGKGAVTYPKWCKIRCYRMVGGKRCEFVSLEFWKENYKTKSYNSPEPNDMWAKRPYAQLAKCAEAQVLRKAFPEELGNEYVKEEMEVGAIEKDGFAHVVEVENKNHIREIKESKPISFPQKSSAIAKKDLQDIQEMSDREVSGLSLETHIQFINNCMSLEELKSVFYSATKDLD